MSFTNSRWILLQIARVQIAKQGSLRVFESLVAAAHAADRQSPRPRTPAFQSDGKAMSLHLAQPQVSNDL